MNANINKTIQIAIIIFLLTPAFANAQLFGSKDLIVKTNGGTIHAYVKDVNYSHVVYRKWFRKHTISSEKVLYVQNGENGAKTYVNNINMAKNYKAYGSMSSATASTSNTPMPQSQKHFIERIGDSYRIDTNQIVGLGKINDLMAQSNNPQVAVSLKAAKTMRFFTTLTNIASYPSSAGGAFASYNTFKTLFEQMKLGQTSFKSYLNAGLSFMGTISLPITKGILKHIRNKLYDHTLITYSLGN
jgi:hypothetical protein